MKSKVFSQSYTFILFQIKPVWTSRLLRNETTAAREQRPPNHDQLIQQLKYPYVLSREAVFMCFLFFLIFSFFKTLHYCDSWKNYFSCFQSALSQVVPAHPFILNFIQKEGYNFLACIAGFHCCSAKYDNNLTVCLLLLYI